MEVLIAQKNQSRLSICIFPEGGVPDDESILLDTFKDGAFRLAIEHQIRLSRLLIIKAIFLYFFSGSPGIMRVKCMIMLILWIKQALIAKKIREDVRDIIYNQ
jgi:1-acyl-sn-glycerol-3-phosphate acyltransferase